MTSDADDSRVILVTGCSRGIGQRYAKRMLALGHRLVSVSRSAPDTSVPGADPGQLITITGDVTDSETVLAARDAALTSFGRIDVLVNNAGGSAPRPEHAVPGSAAAHDYFRDVVELNLTSQIVFCDVVAPVMTAGGRILNLSSSGGRTYARLADASYCAAKAGVVGLTRQLAYQLGPRGITVNAVAPGTTLASPRVRERVEALSEERRAEMMEHIPLRRLAESDDIVGPMEFLTVGRSDYLTGVIVDVNGGFYMA